ncbi:MAG TPA: hypothetical protein VF511_12015 [Chthoniobacterales bacterium]|jgi:hypothetical protein
MRLLIEIIVAVALIALSWNKSFKQWASDAPLIGSHLIAPAQSPAQKKVTTAVPPSTATPPTSFTGHIYYTDEQGKRYWLDAKGKRHYEP